MQESLVFVFLNVFYENKYLNRHISQILGMVKTRDIILCLLLLFFILPSVAANGSSNKFGVIILIIAVVLILITALILITVHWIFMIIDCVKREFKTKFKWLLLLTLVPFAQFFYYFKIKKKLGPISSKKDVDSFALISFISALCAGFLPLVGGVIAIIFGGLAKKNLKKNKLRGIELAKAGIILGIISIVLLILFYIAYFSFLGVLFYQDFSRCLPRNYR